jgi:hypothetical protein
MLSMWQSKRGGARRKQYLTAPFLNGSKAMHIYCLKFRDDGRGFDKLIEFEAQDPSGALSVAGRENMYRSAELWQDGRRICTLQRIGPDGSFWQIAWPENCPTSGDNDNPGGSMRPKLTPRAKAG